MSADPSNSVPDNANSECVGPQSDNAGKASSCAGCPNQSACATGKNRGPDPALAQVAQTLSSVKHKILVLSGKGGVGKSTFSSQLAWTLAGMQKEVGILDIDICGPSVPRMMGVESQEMRLTNTGWSPVYADDNLAVVSVGFMIPSKDSAIVWRGPKKSSLIKQFLTEVAWNDLDFLVVDAPPGTSDEHLTLAEALQQEKIDGAVLITTPQEISLLDVRKEISFCRKTHIPIIGVVENMAGFMCPCCKTNTEIFPPLTGGAVQMCNEMNVPFLGSIPLDPLLLRACEKGESYTANYPDAPALPAFKQVVNNILNSSATLKATAFGAAASNASASAPSTSSSNSVPMS